MKRNAGWLAALVVAAGTIACGGDGSLTAPTAQSSASFVLSGRVLETTDLVERASVGAQIEVVGAEFIRSTVTDRDGVYTIEGLPAGPVQIVVHKAGYESESTAIEILGSQEMDFRLFEAGRRGPTQGRREN